MVPRHCPSLLGDGFLLSRRQGGGEGGSHAAQRAEIGPDQEVFSAPGLSTGAAALAAGERLLLEEGGLVVCHKGSDEFCHVSPEITSSPGWALSFRRKRCTYRFLTYP